MAKIRVAVLFGGVSSEHEVSLMSATNVINSIPKDKYEIICIGITKKGRWLYFPGRCERNCCWHLGNESRLHGCRLFPLTRFIRGLLPSRMGKPM